MKGRFFYRDSSSVERELNSFLEMKDISIKNIKISTSSTTDPIITILVIYERR